MENSNDTAKLVGAVVVGALIGATLGVLFAPDKGSATRDKLMDGAGDLADNLKKKVREGADALRNKVDEYTNMAEEKVDEVLNGAKQKTETRKP